MKKSYLLSTLLAGASVLNGQIVLYDGELAQAVTTNSGASSFNYDSGVTAYGLLAYNGANVTYVEEAAGTTFSGFGSGTVLKMTNNGAVDGALRYNGAQARIADFVNSTGTPSPMAVDIASFPVLSFDIIWDGTGTFANVIVDTNTNAAGAPNSAIVTQALTANVAATVSVDLTSSAAYTDFLSAVAADGTTTFAQFPRISLQTASGESGTFAVDNIRLTAIPEPSSAMALGLGIVGLVLRRRRS